MEKIKLCYHNDVYNKVYASQSALAELSDYFTFSVPNAKFMPSYQNKIWDGKIRIFSTLTCLLYSGITHHLENFCRTRDYELVYQDIKADQEISLIEARKFLQSIAPSNIKVRDYQEEAFVHGIRKRRSLLISPTASGKSFMIYALTKWYDKKTLIVVPTTSLVHQMASDFESYGYPENTIQKIMSGYEKTTNSNVVISTWQSIFRMPQSWFSDFSVVIGDEAHKFSAKSLISIMSKLPNCPNKFGFTGSLDGNLTNTMILEGLFGAVKQITTSAKLMEEKKIADLEIKAINLKYNKIISKEILSKTYQEEIDYIVTDVKRNGFIKNLTLSLSGNTMILFQFVDKQGRVLFDEISKHAEGRRVFFIHGKIDSQTREDIRNVVEKEQNAIIVASFGTSSTGINIPSLSNIIFASPSKSRVRVLQSIGRALRLSDDKIGATLFDISDDFSLKSKQNYSLIHFRERIKLYNTEKFNYKIYNVELY